MWSTTVRRLRPRVVLRWLLLAGWPVHVVFATTTAATLAFALLSDQPAIGDAVGAVALHYALGLWASFAVHELGHAALLMTAPGVTAVTLQRTALRISITPHGRMLGRDAFLTALCGPGCCVVIGVVLWLTLPQLLLHVWYLAQAVFLTPVFSDGRTLLRGIGAWSRPLERSPGGRSLPGADSWRG